MHTVILANGQFPLARVCLEALAQASRIICCDGAAASLIQHGYKPEAIVGDLDSLDKRLLDEYADRVHANPGDQDSNDLTKAVRYCISRDYDEIIILGATGGREDHTIGNIALLMEYSDDVNVKMMTDTGEFIPCRSGDEIETCPGQQVSVFTDNPHMPVSAAGLRYPLDKTRLHNWWKGTLNEASSDQVKFFFSGGHLLVFRLYC